MATPQQITPSRAIKSAPHHLNNILRRQVLLSFPFLGMLLGVVTLLINAWAHQYPALVEHWYSRGLFCWIRAGLDGTLGRLPFASFYLFWFFFVLFWVFLWIKRPFLPILTVKIKYWVGHILGFLGFILTLFFWLWGFHYARSPLPQSLQIQPQPLDSTLLWQRLQEETQALDALRTQLVAADTNALNDQRFWPENAEDTIRAALQKWLVATHFPANGRVRARFIYPKGTLFAFGASGIYWPFVGEGNLEAGMHPLRQLPAMAHEMSHGFGFSDEGACNFIAYVACFEHPNTYIAYCARLDYWATLAGACRAMNPPVYDAEFKPTIPRGIVADQHAIARQHRQYGEIAPALRYQVYDSYLKAQGISSGMLNYDEVLMLVEAWKRRNR